MQEFEYTGKENGKVTHGRILGDNANDALRQLSQRGIQATSLKPADSVSARPVAARRSPAPPSTTKQATPSAAALQFRGKTIGGEVIEGRTQADTPIGAISELDSKQIFPDALTQGDKSVFVRRKSAKDQDIFFAFSQIGELLKAGFTPYDAFGSIGQRVPNAELGAALQAASHAALNGHRLSDSMELYPSIFEPGVVGMIRAGELGGYLPEAATRIGERAKQARSLRRWFWFYYPAAVNLFAMVPGAFIMPRYLVGSFDLAEKTNAAPGDFSSAATAFRMYVVGEFLPIVLALFAVSGLLLWWWNLPRQRARRHAASLRIPGLKGRAVNECLYDFFHNLGALTNVGLSPNQAWWVASRSVANLVVARELAKVGSNFRPETSFTKADVRHRYFPQEFYTMVYTGEKTGRMAEIMQTLAADAENRAKVFGGVIRYGGLHLVVILTMVAAGLFICLLFFAWYITLPKKVMDGMETRIVAPQFSRPADSWDDFNVQ
jgi:type II secretory pathway component PulF